MRLDRHCIDSTKIEGNNFEKREQDILARVKKHYGQKLEREITDIEAKEISDNLLHFAQAIYGL